MAQEGRFRSAARSHWRAGRRRGRSCCRSPPRCRRHHRRRHRHRQRPPPPATAAAAKALNLPASTSNLKRCGAVALVAESRRDRRRHSEHEPSCSHGLALAGRPAARRAEGDGVPAALRPEVAALDRQLLADLEGVGEVGKSVITRWPRAPRAWPPRPQAPWRARPQQRARACRRWRSYVALPYPYRRSSSLVELSSAALDTALASAPLDTLTRSASSGERKRRSPRGRAAPRLLSGSRWRSSWPRRWRDRRPSPCGSGRCAACRSRLPRS